MSSPFTSLIEGVPRVQVRTPHPQSDVPEALGISLLPKRSFFLYIRWWIMHVTAFSPATYSGEHGNREGCILTFSSLAASCIWQRVNSGFRLVNEHLRVPRGRMCIPLRQMKELDGFRLFPWICNTGETVMETCVAPSRLPCWFSVTLVCWLALSEEHFMTISLPTQSPAGACTSLSS